MKTAPKSLRLHIGIFGRTNVGKSSFLNLVAGQDVAITSPVAGTTTDVVEKSMEILPIGPVVFLDTAGIDDTSALAQKRLQKTRKIFERADVAALIVEPGVWTGYEDGVIAESAAKKIPVIVVVNKIDAVQPSGEFIDYAVSQADRIITVSSTEFARRDDFINSFKQALIGVCPESFLNPLPLVSDLIPAGGLVVLVVPIDLQAPKGRLILPQVQTIRDALDGDAGVMVVKEREYAAFLQKLNTPPDLVVCDSQVILKMVADTPLHVKCTTFSVLFSRYKGELLEAVRGARLLESLQPGDKVLIAEACSHHAIEDDIGRVKIPRWLRQYAGHDVAVEVSSGRDYPDNLADYKLVIHCGACMLTRREMLNRIDRARQAGVAISNYGICIAALQGALTRILSPFPAALEILGDYPRQSLKR